LQFVKSFLRLSLWEGIKRGVAALVSKHWREKERKERASGIIELKKERTRSDKKSTGGMKITKRGNINGDGVVGNWTIVYVQTIKGRCPEEGVGKE